MDDQTVRELAAAYALDALDPEEERAFEELLARSPQLRREVASFREVAAALAHDTDAPPPPAALRGRILDQARAERANVVPLRPRWAFPVAAAAAAVAACAAIGLGIWAATLNGKLDDERSAADAQAEVVAVLAAGGAERVPLTGAEGSVVVAPDGQAVLVVDGLAAAPDDKTYQAWVIEGGAPVSAGTFESGGDRTAVVLGEHVPAGAVVAVTIEDAGGAAQPTAEQIFATSPA
jgi:anti-sigma-K factor RskA